MRVGVISTAIGLALTHAAAAQTYATSEEPYVQSVPIYKAYNPQAFDSGAYEAGTQPFQPAPVLDVQPIVGDVYEAIPHGVGTHEVAQPLPFAPALEVQPIVDGAVYEGAPNDPQLGDDLSLSLGAPETFAAPQNQDSGDAGFRQETETSRLLLALEKTYATRVSEMKERHLLQRSAMLDAFEKQASDPNQVIGLAERMRVGLAELTAVQQASLAEEERQFTAATLSVLDRAPSRSE